LRRRQQAIGMMAVGMQIKDHGQVS
jgi:hypothetical protein